MLNQRNTSDKLVIFGAVAALIVLVVLCIFLTNLVTNITSAFIPLVAGSMLLVGNAGSLLNLVRSRKPSPAVFNAMIGLALVLFGLGTTIFGNTWLRILLYAPGIGLLLMALPIALSKPSMFGTYRRWGGRVTGAMRRVKRRGSNVTSGSFNTSSGQQTIQLDPTSYNQTNDPYNQP